MAKTFEELRKEMQSNYGRQVKKDPREVEPSETSKASFSDLRKEMNERYNLVSKVSDDFINTFYTDANNYLKSAKDAYDGIGYSTAASVYGSQAETVADLRARSGAIRQYLKANKNSIDSKTYDSFSSELDSLEETMSKYLNSFSEAKKYYGQFKTEDEYNVAKLYSMSSKEIKEYIDKLNVEKVNAVLSGDLDALKNKDGLFYTLSDGSKVSVQDIYEAKHAEEILTNPDFEYYSQMGANIKNPNIEDVPGKGLYFGKHLILGKEGAEVGNVVTLSRDNAEYIAIMEMNGGTTADYGLKSKYRFMTDEEVSIYNYYLGKGEKEKADDYLDTLEDTLTQRQGGQIAENIKGNKLQELIFAAGAGLENFAYGVGNLDNYITGTKADPLSATQYAAPTVRKNMDGGWKVAYDVANTTGNMLPSILVGAATGGIGGAATMGVSTMGNAYAEMRNLGYDEWQSRGYGLLVGASEAALQYGLGGISKLGGKVSGNAVSKLVSKVDNALARTAIKLGGNMASEGLEEAIQTALEPAFKALVTGEDFEAAEWDDILYSVFLGALSAGMLEGAPTIAGTVHSNYKTNVAHDGMSNTDAIKAFWENKSFKDVKNAYNAGKQSVTESAGSYVNEALEIDPDNAHAQRMQSRLDKGKNVSGYQINRLVEANEQALRTQDTAKIKSSVAERLTSLGETGDVDAIAAALTKQASGENLSLSEKNLIKKSKFGQRVANEISPENIKSGGYTSAWAEKIGTERINAESYNKGLYDLAAEKAGITVDEKKPSVTVDATKKEIATESKFEVSTDGKTKLGDTEVSIKEIASVKNGEVMLRLEDGSTVKASDVEYGSSEEGLMYEMVAKMDAPTQTLNALIKGFNAADGVSAQVYAIDIPLAYKYGKINYKAGLEKLNLTPEQRNTAFVLGRDDAKASGRTWSDTSRRTPETNKSRASDDGIIYDGVDINEDGLTDIQKASLTGIRTLAKMSPTLEIHITGSVVENGKKYVMVNGEKKLAPNGYFRNGNEIYIDINAGKGAKGAMLFTMSHEVVHFIAENSFEDFQALADFLFEHYGNNNVPVDSLIKREIDNLKKSYEASGKEVPSEDDLYMKAYEEVVANAMSKMLADPKSYEKLAKLKSENLTLWEKIGEAIKQMLDKLKSMLGIYEGRNPDQMAADYVNDFASEVYDQLQDLYLKGFVNAEANYQATIGSRKLEDFADAKNTEGDTLLQYKAMEADEDTYRDMLKKWGKMTDTQINNLFLTIDNAMDLIKDNLEALDYAWEADIDDRAFSPVKPNSDKLYQVSLDFSTLCRKRILQQTVAAQLQEALNKPLSREEGIAIRDALIALQEEGRQIEVACALCYVESARMKSPEQIKRFIENREAVIKEFFAGKSGGDIKTKLKKAEDDVRGKLYKENPNGIKGKDGVTMLDPRTAKLNTLPKKYADEIREAKRATKRSYTPTAEEQRVIEVAKGMTVSDFTSPEGLENLAKNYPSLFDAYTSYIRNATKSKGIENDTWWRAGDSMQIGDVLIANMNRENGLRSQSWSDFQVVHILDYIASTIELATRETKEQAYSKVPDYVELMGNTGVMINMSLIPSAKFNGTLDYDSVEGIDYKRALELRDKYHATAGTICIGVDNGQIKLLLEDITIDYVIPYHKSGMSAAIRKLMHIPTWSQYEEYQSEKNLSRADAEKQAKKYGVTLLAESDPNYHKCTSFSEWFDIKEAQQIAKMENANPSDKAKQKKYGVMHGGYMAMQNAANNYLKLCAERGITPKFSHEKADFTAEDNYWKLLIDRKMVDNITGKVIEQQTIKPIFDEKEIMRILNDELERYPKVKADQDYAIRKVTEGMLSGEIKGGMSAKDIAKVMQTPVDNVTNVNIFASAEGDTLYSMDDYSDEDSAYSYDSSKDDFYKDSKIYSYDFLVNQKDMKVLDLPALSKIYTNKNIDRERIISEGKKNALAQEGSKVGINDVVYVKNKYTQRMIEVNNQSIRHGIGGEKHYTMTNARLGLIIGDIIRNGIPINELKPSAGAEATYAMVAYAVSPEMKPFLAIAHIDIISGKLVDFDTIGTVHSLKGRMKKGSTAAINSAQGLSIDSLPFVASEISISQLLEFVNSVQQSILSDNVLNHFNDTRKPEGYYYGQVLHSAQDSDSVSTRSLLANALESVAQNDIERNKLNEYKSKIDRIEAEYEKLTKIKAELKELSFPPKGTKKDIERINALRFEENQTANRINTYDRQLLNLEATTALKNVLQREKELARRKEAQKGKEALAEYREKAAKTQRELMTRYQESRKKNVEGRKKTEMRYKIKNIVSELNTLLLNPTAKKHIKEELRKEVADALSAINFDTVGADERVAMYNDLIAKERDPDVIAELTKTRDRIQLQGENLKEKLNALQMAYEKIKNTDDIELNLAYQEVIKNSIMAVSEKVGKTSIRNMTLDQLEMVYDLFKMVRHTIRDANKSFKTKKGETIMQMAEAVNDQVRTVGGQPYKRNAINANLQRIGWTFLKPYVAFRTIGSVTLTNMYKELRSGEDTFYADVSEAQAFIEEQYKKHGYKSWDMKKTKTFTAKSGKTFDLTLEQMMSLYAYSRREQAHDHIIEGGIVFEDALIVEKNKLGVPIKYEVTTKDAFNLSEDTFAEVANSLTAEQKAFVDEMQAYLSDTMGAKGNEVSMELLGVKLFKEKFYLPIKSSQYYMNFKAEEAGEVKLKSPTFSKETVQHANNPIVIHNFTDLWAEHINDMAMYHSFVLALEDFTRVYNYKTKTDAKVETMDTKATLETAYPGVTKYISKFLKDMNGGVRGETVGWAEKLTSLAKKGAVLGSASVAIQQPSAVMRAMAYINPKYFVITTHKSVNLVKHKQDFEELKKYAPLAGIKEMGRFDVGMGQGTVDWIKSNKTVIEKAEEFISVPPAFMDEVTWVSIWNAVKRETVSKHKNLSPKSEEFLKIAGERFTEVISLSQVYDSVFSRSDLMRNKSWIAKSLTAFMAEPSTVLNMIWDSWVQAKRLGGVKAYVKATTVTGGAIVASIVLNSALKAIVLAMRDDDEDESYAEKYLEHFVGDLKDSLNPLSLIPFVKDIVSIFQGYDVERMDMALFSDLKKAIDAFDSDSKTAYEKWSGLIGAISAFFGVPAKNVERDIRALINTVFGKTEKTTAMGLHNALKEGWSGKEISNAQQLYEAMVRGDTEQIKRVSGRFKTQSEIVSALRSALRDNDPRIQEAVIAHYEGDIARRVAITQEIEGEGNFDANIVRGAINNAITNLNAEVKNALKAKAMGDSEGHDKIVKKLLKKYPKKFVEKMLGETTVEEDTESKDVSLYTMNDYYTSILNGNTVTADTIYRELINEKLAEGYLQVEAEDLIASSFSTKVKEAYMDGDITRSKATSLLVSHGNKSDSEAEVEVKKCDFELKHGISWSERARAYRLGKISESELISAVMDIESETWEGAEEYIRFLDLEIDNPTIDITANDAAKYFEYAEPVGIDVEVYLDYKEQTKGLVSDKDENGNSISGSKKAKVMAVINSLPISSSQKDALYKANGWAESKLYEAPWH